MSGRSLAVVGLVAALVLGACSDEVATSSPTTTPSSPVPVASSRTPDPTPTEDEERWLLVWGRGGFDRAVADELVALDGVTRVGFRRRDDVGLRDVVAADGTVVVDRVDRWREPASALAIDPDRDAAALLAEVDADLAPGEVWLSEASAALHDVGVGGTIELVGREGLRVAAVVPDAALGSSEVVLHADDADAIGFDADGSLVVHHAREDVEALAAEIEAVLPEDVTARVVDPDDLGGREAPLVLPQVEVKRRFGAFAFRPRDGVREIDQEPDWIDANIVKEDVPVLGGVICHRAIFDDLRAALTEVVARGVDDWIDRSRYGGCFHARRTTLEDDAGLSRHSWGIAIDINVDMATPGHGEVPPDAFIEAFEENGFRWGGRFLSPDNHHWEWVGRD